MKRLLTGSLALVLSLGIGLGVGNANEGSEEAEITTTAEVKTVSAKEQELTTEPRELTREQKQEVERVKKETKELRANYEKEKRTLKADKVERNRNADPAAIGAYPTRAGTFLVTYESDSNPLSSWTGGHAGMVYNKYNTIESFGNGTRKGVQWWPNNWATRYKTLIGRTVSGTTIAQDAYAAKWASYQIGDPYNYNFWYLNTNNAFYCSQLVWRAFQFNYGKNLNYGGGAVWPSDLHKTSFAYTIYVK